LYFTTIVSTIARIKGAPPPYLVAVLSYDEKPGIRDLVDRVTSARANR